MKGLKYSEILRSNSELGKSLQGRRYEIVLLSNIVVTQLKEILEYSLRTSGINARVTTGDYDAIVQDSLKHGSADLTIVFWEAANIVDGLQYKAGVLGAHETGRLVRQNKERAQLRPG